MIDNGNIKSSEKIIISSQTSSDTQRSRKRIEKNYKLITSYLKKYYAIKKI